jgi:hypothetical protein
MSRLGVMLDILELSDQAVWDRHGTIDSRTLARSHTCSRIAMSGMRFADYFSDMRRRE